VAHVATLECLNEGALLFLKTNNSRLGFYKKRGYASLVASLPAKLRKLVPSANYVTTASETTLLSTPVSVLRIRGAGKKDTLTKGATRSSGLPDSDDSDDDNDDVPAKKRARVEKARAKDDDADDDEDIQKPPAALQKRVRVEQARAKKMETCEIDHSDKSDSEHDFRNFVTTPISNDQWTLPIKDFWEPQDKNNKKFRAKEPELSHRPTQLEMFARYPLTPQPLPLGRVKIIREAISFKTNTNIRRNAGSTRHNLNFREQTYLDLACVWDENRPISVEPKSYVPETQLIRVAVSSYKIPPEATLQSLLADRDLRRSLEREVRSVHVDLEWLKSACRPDISNVIDEMFLGSKVVRVRGANIGTADANTLSFSGAVERAQGFVSLPQGQKKAIYELKNPPPPDPKKPKQFEMWYDSQHHVTDRMRKVQHDLHLEHGLTYAPPPPKDDTQIVKLKWLPSKKSKRPLDGIWHGLFAVDLGDSKSNTTLQQCSLTQEWVEAAFSRTFRRQCQAIATNAATTKRNENKYLYIPAGDSRNTDDDPPPPDELTEVGVRYQQGTGDSCLRHSMASAFHAMGFTEEAKSLALEESISGSTVGLAERASQFLRKVFQKSNLVLKKVFNTACSVEQVTQEDFGWPMVLIIQTSDGGYGSHAVTAWKGMIFDSTCPKALRWSQRSLDWCSGQHSTCIGFSKVYRLCPADFGFMSLDSKISIGTQVRSHLEGTDALGWVRRLPTKKKDGTQKKGYILCYTDGGMAELSHADVSKHLLE
jgi:hypothetical protein